MSCRTSGIKMIYVALAPRIRVRSEYEVGFALSDRIDRIATEILAAGGSFALWGAIAAFLETLPTLRYKTKLLQQVALTAEIRFKREG